MSTEPETAATGALEPLPDLMQAVLAAHPGEMTLSGTPGGWYLRIVAADLDVTGSWSSGRRDRITGLAVGVERMLLDLRRAGPRCECGDLQTSHDMRLKTKQPCGRSGCGCATWTPSEGAA